MLAWSRWAFEDAVKEAGALLGLVSLYRGLQLTGAVVWETIASLWGQAAPGLRGHIAPRPGDAEAGHDGWHADARGPWEVAPAAVSAQAGGSPLLVIGKCPLGAARQRESSLFEPRLLLRLHNPPVNGVHVVLLQTIIRMFPGLLPLDLQQWRRGRGQQDCPLGRGAGDKAAQGQHKHNNGDAQTEIKDIQNSIKGLNQISTRPLYLSCLNDSLLTSISN